MGKRMPQGRIDLKARAGIVKVEFKNPFRTKECHFLKRPTDLRVCVSGFIHNVITKTRRILNGSFYYFGNEIFLGEISCQGDPFKDFKADSRKVKYIFMEGKPS